MSITYPTTLDSLPNPTSTDLMENATTALDHDQQHSNANDAIEALEAKVGINSSAVTTSHDYKLGEVTSSDKAVGKTATQTLTNKTLTAPQINFGSDANGDIIIRNGSGVTSRLAAGTSGQILNIDSGTSLPAWVANPSATTADYSTSGVSTIDAGVRFYAADASASSTAYTATLSPVPSAYVTGQTFKIKFVNANTTTTPTLNLNGLGAKTIVKGVSTALVAGDIATNMVGTVTYDGTNFVLQNPAVQGYQEYVFTSSGSWLCPRGVTSVLVDIVAGGGGGGGASNVSGAGGGGGGGSGAFNVSSNVTALTSYTVTVGAGGTAGNNSGSNGGNGGTSSFNGISKSGGTGGTGTSSSSGGSGGAAGDASAGAGGAGGSSAGNGTNGSVGSQAGTGGTGGTAGGGASGGGGGGASGFGTNGGNGAAGGAGNNGTVGAFGAGAGGGSNQGSGGVGGAGIVIIKVPLSQIV